MSETLFYQNPNAKLARDLWSHRIAGLLCFATLVLLAAGALVTGTGSSLAIPDWPLAYGQFFPPMVGGILYEHGHRLIDLYIHSRRLASASQAPPRMPVAPNTGPNQSD